MSLPSYSVHTPDSSIPSSGNLSPDPKTEKTPRVKSRTDSGIPTPEPQEKSRMSKTNSSSRVDNSFTATLESRPEKTLLSKMSRADTFDTTITDLEKNGGRGSPGPTVNGEKPFGTPPAFPAHKMSAKREIVFLFTVCMIQLLPSAALTACFPISSIIAKWFHIGTPIVLPWMVAAYATTFGSFILISGRLGDIFGHRFIVIFGFGLMTGWSIVAAISHYVSPMLFFASRAVQGIAASMMIPNGLALLGRTYPPGSRKKILAFSLFGLCAPLGQYLGMLFGAVFAEYLDWWIAFYVFAGVSLLCAITSKKVFLAPEPLPHQMKPFGAKMADVDWLGAFTGISGLICIQVAFIAAPAVKWQTTWIPMLLVIGLILVAAFVVVEIKVAKHPLIPFRMLKADVGLVLGAVACGWAVFGIWSWYLWRYLLVIRKYSPVESAIHVLPIVPVAFIAAALTAYLMRTTKPAFILLYATVAATLGPLFLFFAPPTQSYWGFTFVSILVMPVFMDFCLPAATYIMSNYFPLHMQGVSASLVVTVLNYSIALGIGLATTAEIYADPHGKEPLKGIRSGWIMGVVIGAIGILICAVFLYKSVLSAKARAPNRAPTIRELDEEAHGIRPSMSIRHPNSRPATAQTRVSIPNTMKTNYSERGLLDDNKSKNRMSAQGSTKPKRASTIRSFRNALGAGRGRSHSTASAASSLFPLTRNSSPDPNIDRGEEFMTALPDWRDRMMPQFEWRQVPVGTPTGRESTASPSPGLLPPQSQAERLRDSTYHRNMTQQVRFYKGTNSRVGSGITLAPPRASRLQKRGSQTSSFAGGAALRKSELGGLNLKKQGGGLGSAIGAGARRQQEEDDESDRGSVRTVTGGHSKALSISTMNTVIR